MMMKKYEYIGDILLFVGLKMIKDRMIKDIIV